MGNWREVSNQDNNSKVNTTKKNWRDAVGADKTDLESIKVKPYVAAPTVNMPTASTASYSARKALNSSSVTEDVAQPSLNPSLMPGSNTEYWEKGMPRANENQNKKTSETPKQVLSAITDIGASVIKGFLNETGNFPKTTGQVLEGVSNLANKNALTKAVSTLIPAPFQPLVNNGQAINQSLLKPTGEAIRNTGDKFNRQNENNSALWNNTLSTAESFGRMGADIPMSLASGLPTPAIMGITNADETYNDNISKGMNPKEALMRAAVSGAIEGGSEYALGGETVSKVIKGQWKELLAKGGKEAAEEAMKKTLGHKAWDFVKNEILAEAGQEAGTEVLHDVADTVLNGTYNGQWNDGRTLKEDVSNALWAGYGGGLLGAVGGGVGVTVKTILNAPGLQAEVVAQTPEGAIIQTETGEQMPVRNVFLQNAEVQEVNVNPAQVTQEETKPQMQSVEPDKVTEAVKNMTAAKNEHEAGKVETKDYLNNIAKENNIIDTEQDSNVSVNDEVVFTDRKNRVNGGTVIKDHGNGLYEIQTESENGLEYALVKHDGKSFKSMFSSPTKVDDIPIENRTFENVGNRKVKAYQYLHPELKSFIQDEATVLMGELDATLPAQRSAVLGKDGEYIGSGNKRYAHQDIVEIKNLGASYEDIKKAIHSIIKDNGAENYALAKKAELIINDRLERGYNVMGEEIAPNKEYINLKNQIEKGEALKNALKPQISKETSKGTNTQGVQNKGITEALMSSNGQAVVDKIKNDMKSQGIDANFEVIKGTTAFHKDIKKLAKGLGVEVVFYKGDKVPNGFISNSVKNTIFIHSNGQRNEMVATTGHEFLHHVKKTYAKEYGELLNFAKTYFTEDARKAFLDTYSNVPSLQADLAANEDSLLEEMLADEMGNNFVDKNFWQRVYEHSKELFEKLVEAAGKILKSVSGEKYDTYVAQETADTLSKKFENVIAEVRKQVAEGKVDTEARIEDGEGVQLSEKERKILNEFKDGDIESTLFSIRDRNLVSLHNISTEKLLKAIELGGMPVPSIAIAKKDIPFTFGGEITLVGNKDLVNPEKNSNNLVYNTDVYSRRIPSVRSEVNNKEMYKIMDKIRASFKETGDYDYSVQDFIERGDADEAIRGLIDKKGMKLQYLKEQGEKIEMPMRDVASKEEFSTPEILNYLKTHPEALETLYPAKDSQVVKDLSPLIKDALIKPIEQRFNLKQASKELLIKRTMDNWFDENGMLNFGKIDTVMKNLNIMANPKKEVDTGALKDLLDSKISTEQQKNDYRKWLENLLDPAWGNKYFLDNGRKKKYNIDTLFEYMSGKVKATENFHPGPGTAKAKGAKKFNTVEDIYKDEDSITTEDKVEEFKKQFEQANTPVMSAIKEHHIYPNGYEVFDDYYNAMGDMLAGKTPAMALSKNGFKNVPKELQLEFKAMGKTLKDAPVNYFEAKPQRIVTFREFDGAVVPEDTKPEVIEKLKKAGIKNIVKYNHDSNESRKNAVMSFEDAGLTDGRQPLTNDFISSIEKGVTIPYAHNTQKSVKIPGDTYAQSIEPSGEYMIHDDMKGKYKIPGWEYGEITFKKPLVIEHETTGHGGWKTKLSEMYGGKKGKALSNAIMKDGYDAIVTVDSKDKQYNEIINLKGEKQSLSKASEYFSAAEEALKNSESKKNSLKLSTRSKEFKQWFGDSKVVDEKTGEPLVVYHGTSSIEDFNEFLTLNDSEPGAHFGTAEAANEFGNRVYPVYLSIQNPLEVDDIFSSATSVYRGLKEMIFNGKLPKNEAWNKINQLQEENRQILKKSGRDGVRESNKNLMKSMVDYVKSLGYDGFKYQNEVEDEGNISWVAFEPTQVKSAIGNNGQYSNENPDIRYSTREKQKIEDVPFYRGTSVNGKRVVTGNPVWDNNIFITDREDSARWYGKDVENIRFKPNSKVLYEGTSEFNKLGRWKKTESMLDFGARIVAKAKELGYDAVHFKSQTDVGTVVMNPDSLVRNYKPDTKESVRQKERQHYSKQYNNSEAMDEEVYKRISNEAKFIDERMSIKSVAEEADKRVKANPKKYIDKIRDSESFGSPEDVAEAEYALLTVQQAAREFDKQGDKTKAEQQWNIAASIASKIITHFSTASRTLNMGKLWRMLDSQGVIRIAEKMLDKETTPEQKKKLRTEAGELIKAINKLDEEGLSKIKEALGFDKDVEVTAQEILDEAEYSRDSNFDEVDERVKEVAELFDTIEARNAKKIADKVKSSIKSVLEGIDFGIKFMARGLELNTSESVNDKIARLTEEYYSKPLSERGNLAKILAKELNIPMVQADTIAKRINDTMKEVTREEKIKALKGEETTEEIKTTIEKWLTPKMRKSPEVKSWIDRIVELSESGSLTKEDLLPLIAAKYDFKVMTPEISRNLTKIAEKIQSLESGTDEYNRAVNALNDYMNSLVKHDIFEYLNTIENLAMLSGTKSMIRNVVGNAGRLISYDVEKFGSALLDMARTAVSKDKTRKVLMPNLKAQVKGIGQGYYKEVVDVWNDTDSRSTEDTREFARYIKYKNKPMSIFQRYVKLLMTDRPFTQAMVNEVVTEAEKLAKKNNVEFDISEARQIAEEEAAKTFFNGDDKVINAILNIRRTANFGKSWGIGSIVLKFAKVPYNISKFAVEREYHLASMKVLYKAISTGYGAVNGKNSGYLKDEKFDSKAFIQDIAKVGSGALIMHLGTLLFTLGMIRVRPDDDDKDKKLLGLEKLVGFNKYQLNLSAIRRYFVEGEPTKEPQEGDLLATLDWFAPLSILMIAGIKSQMEHEKKSMQPGERGLAWYRKLWDYAVANPAAGIGEGILEQVNTVLEMPFLQSLNKFKYAENWQDGLMEVVKDIPARFVPAPVKYVKESMDNTQRETYTDEATGVGEAINKVKVKLPGVSKNMEPKIDMLGNELELYQNAKNNFLNIAINPAITTRYQTTPEAKKLLDVYQRFGIKTHIPTPVDKKFTAKKSEYKSLEKDESIVLTAPEYRYYQQEYGLGVKKLLENFTVYDDPSYKTSQEKTANKLNDKYTELKQEIQRKILEKRGIK